MVINNVIFNVELQSILDELVVQLRANGIEYIQRQRNNHEHIQICCPYHNNGMERRPSAGLRKSDGVFHCFACGEVHSLPEVISYCFGYTDDILGKFGWQWLLKNFAVIQIEERKDVAIDFYRDNKRDNGGGGDFISEEELDRYRYIHPYMYKRGLTDEIIERFDIGYDKVSDSITFPIRDVGGNVLFLAKRSVRSKFFSYPKGVEKPVYGLYEYTQEYYKPHDRLELDNLYEVIICESMLDALSCWVYGKYAVALNGLGNELQIQQLRQMPCRKFILATDNDKAGLEARTKLRSALQDVKLISEYILPDGRKDINELSKNEFDNLIEIF